MAPLSSTSYAILGHLAMQDWTMYDLAQQMRRNVVFFFPRAESQVYAEPKRLVSLGYATARAERTGRRERTVYAITGAGRAALSAWLAEPPSKGFQLEFEAFLRVFLAPSGSTDDLLRAVEHIRAEMAAMADQAFRIRDEYLEGRAPFQRYAVHRALVHDFLTSFAVMAEAWAERTQERLAAWPQEDEAQRLEAAREMFRSAGAGRGGIRRRGRRGT
jgi:DNA-binding PadR family transcriptional regulator